MVGFPHKDLTAPPGATPASLGLTQPARPRPTPPTGIARNVPALAPTAPGRHGPPVMATLAMPTVPDLSYAATFGAVPHDIIEQAAAAAQRVFMAEIARLTGNGPPPVPAGQPPRPQAPDARPPAPVASIADTRMEGRKVQWGSDRRAQREHTQPEVSEVSAAPAAAAAPEELEAAARPSTPTEKESRPTSKRSRRSNDGVSWVTRAARAALAMLRAMTGRAVARNKRSPNGSPIVECLPHSPK
jgi:hypothetical protein